MEALQGAGFLNCFLRNGQKGMATERTGCQGAWLSQNYCKAAILTRGGDHDEATLVSNLIGTHGTRSL